MGKPIPGQPTTRKVPGGPWLGYVSNGPVAPNIDPQMIAPTPGAAPAAGQVPAAPLAGSFDVANSQIDQAKAALLSAQARAGQQGVAAYQNARSAIGSQQADALALARAGTTQAPGLDAITANLVNGPSQQRTQALTQAQANMSADIARSGAATQQYLGSAQAVLPIQQQQFDNQLQQYSQGWDRWLQLQQMQDEAAAQAAAARTGEGGGGGGGGSSAAAPKALTAGQVNDLLTSLGGQVRDQAGGAYLDAADRLLAGPASANQYEVDQLNLAPYEDKAFQEQQNTLLAQRSAGNAAAAPAGGVSFDPDFSPMQVNGSYRPIADQAPPAPILSGTANLSPAGGLGHALSGVGGGTVPAPAGPSTAFDWNQPSAQAWTQRAADLGARQNEIGKTLAGLAGPQYGTYGQIGGQALDTLNSPLSNYAPQASILAQAMGYNLGPYNDPTLAQGMFPLQTPYEGQRSANDRLGEQIQAQTQARTLGGFQADAQHFGTTDPSILGFAQQAAQYSSADTAARAKEQAASDAQTAALAKAGDEQKIAESVDLWMAAVGQADPNATPEGLYADLLDQGIAPDRASQIATTVAGQAKTIYGVDFGG